MSQQNTSDNTQIHYILELKAIDTDQIILFPFHLNVLSFMFHEFQIHLIQRV